MKERNFSYMEKCFSEGCLLGGYRLLTFNTLGAPEDGPNAGRKNGRSDAERRSAEASVKETNLNKDDEEWR